MQERELHDDKPGPVWIKSMRSATLNACVELARDGDHILVRDSKNPAEHLRYSQVEITSFFEGVKRGEFDHLLDAASN